jgi:hypothetical protein
MLDLIATLAYLFFAVLTAALVWAVGKPPAER